MTDRIAVAATRGKPRQRAISVTEEEEARMQPSAKLAFAKLM